MTKQERLRALHEKWFSKCTCALKKTATQPVPGDGSAHAQIVFIGEAPGKSEDMQGRPFVGAAGKFLTEMLESINLKRDDVYITNIVKYRPPNNRNPEPSEKEACRAWLTEELNVIQPKVIVFLGRHAMNTFFPGEQISKVHGKLLVKKFPYIETTYFLPLYHPAAALYDGSMRETLKKDFKKITHILKKIQ
ncbi:MAG: uracil-DNA glycosylase [Candidatus Pacebacteria bacterium]|jgi:DNA polymerase|nr:uracil-DNA glycosylase [Candidatus Paceibacterota bacterium]